MLSPHLLLADQLAVTGDDLVRSTPDAQTCEDAVAHLLAHRFDLLGRAGRRGTGRCGTRQAVCAAEPLGT